MFIRYGTGYDLASRRKNATRESTATLKAWLNEHKKNPYPTKGEKIMLAIITKMTLTQVSYSYQLNIHLFWHGLQVICRTKWKLAIFPTILFFSCYSIVVHDLAFRIYKYNTKK